MTGEKIVSGVDFVAIPCKDAQASKEFYEDVLGLDSSFQWGEMPAFEFETGDVTIAVMFKANRAPTGTVRLGLYYQACDEQACLPPVTKQLEVPSS